MLVWVDVDANGRTGLGGADLQFTIVGLEVALERWDPRAEDWVPDDLPTRARFRNSGHLLSVDVHVSELGNTRRFGFSLASADVNTAAQQVQAADFAPDGFAFWRYALTNKPALKLVVTRVFASASGPMAGRPFTVGFAVTRSDTGRPVTSGTVGCRVVSRGHKVHCDGPYLGRRRQVHVRRAERRYRLRDSRNDHRAQQRQIGLERLRLRRSLARRGTGRREPTRTIGTRMIVSMRRNALESTGRQGTTLRRLRSPRPVERAVSGVRGAAPGVRGALAPPPPSVSSGAPPGWCYPPRSCGLPPRGVISTPVACDSYGKLAELIDAGRKHERGQGS